MTISVLVMLWWATSAIEDDDAGRDPQRALGPLVHWTAPPRRRPLGGPLSA